MPPVNSDGGKSWMGGYRAERNASLKFIADNEIVNVVSQKQQKRIAELEATVARLAATVKDQAAQIEKVSRPLGIAKACPTSGGE
jgi:hypothetical protein